MVFIARLVERVAGRRIPIQIHNVRKKSDKLKYFFCFHLAKQDNGIRF
jgi:hypothetical protein